MKLRVGRVGGGVALLLVSCGSVTEQSDGGGRGGSGAAGGASGQTGGTGGAGASCGAVSPCGGNIVGTWKVTRTCLTATGSLGSLCDGGGSANIAFAFSGTVTYNADGTYSSMLTGTEMAHENYPSGCAPFGATCQQLGQEVIDGGTISCSTDTAGRCTCDTMVPLRSTSPSGTYTTSGSTLTTISASNTSTSSFCVQGSVLYEIAGPGDGGTLTSMGDAVFTKQ